MSTCVPVPGVNDPPLADTFRPPPRASLLPSSTGVIFSVNVPVAPGVSVPGPVIVTVGAGSFHELWQLVVPQPL